MRALRLEAEASYNHYRALRFATMLSGALLAAGETAEAEHIFSGVMRSAATAGLYQSILDEGPEVGTLLLGFPDNARRAGDCDDLLPYAGRLIAGWRDLYHPAFAADPTLDVVEALSSRERNILERVGQGRSNKEIARELGIAPETVKSHIKNIFIKLGVNRRAHAVSRAQNLGLGRI